MLRNNTTRLVTLVAMATLMSVLAPQLTCRHSSEMCARACVCLSGGQGVLMACAYNITWSPSSDAAADGSSSSSSKINGDININSNSSINSNSNSNSNSSSEQRLGRDGGGRRERTSKMQRRGRASTGHDLNDDGKSSKTPEVARACARVCGGGASCTAGSLAHSRPQRGAAVVEEGHAVTRHASLNGRGERACGQRSCTSAASVLLLAP